MLPKRLRKLLARQVGGLFVVHQELLALIGEEYLQLLFGHDAVRQHLRQHGDGLPGIFRQGNQAQFGFVETAVVIRIGAVKIKDVRNLLRRMERVPSLSILMAVDATRGRDW